MSKIVMRNRLCRMLAVLAIPVLSGACAARHPIPYFEASDPGSFRNTVTPQGVQRAEDAGKQENTVHLEEFDLSSSSKPVPARLGKEDVVRMMVVDYPEMTQDASVQRDGTVIFPLVGVLTAEGKTIGELQAEVQNKIKNDVNSRELRLETGDVVKMTVWLHPDLTQVAFVQPDGMITLPLIGELKAEGRTVPEICAEARTKLAKYINSPQVSIVPEKLRRKFIANAQVFVLPVKLRPRQAAVIGEVLVPGLYTIHGDTKIMEVLAKANYKDTAQLNSVVIIRNRTNAVPEYRMLKLEDFASGKAPEQNIYLRSDDIILVPKTFIAKVDEFVDKYFARTKPVFDWWTAMEQARYADETGQAIRRLNDQLFRNQ